MYIVGVANIGNKEICVDTNILPVIKVPKMRNDRDTFNETSPALKAFQINKNRRIRFLPIRIHLFPLKDALRLWGSVVWTAVLIGLNKG